MSKNYKITDAPNSSIVKIDITIEQIKLLEKLVEAELVDVEEYDCKTNENALQGLCDVFWKHLHIPLTEAEKEAQKPYMDAYHASNIAFQESLARESLNHD